jgi:hypothetical protein
VLAPQILACNPEPPRTAAASVAASISAVATAFFDGLRFGLLAPEASLGPGKHFRICRWRAWSASAGPTFTLTRAPSPESRQPALGQIFDSRDIEQTQERNEFLHPALAP